MVALIGAVAVGLALIAGPRSWLAPAAVAAGGAIVGNLLVTTAGPLVAAIAGMERRRRRRLRADRELSRQFPVAVDWMVQRLQSGHSLHTVVGELDRVEPVTALAPAARALRSGNTLQDSVAAMPTGPSVDGRVELLALTLGTLARNGGPSVPALQRLRVTMIGFVQAEEEAAVHAGQALASAGVLAIAPVLFSLTAAAVDDGARTLYLHETIGTICVVVAIVMSYGGWRWMLRSVDRHRGQPGPDEALAPTIDLLAVVLGAGGTIAQAVVAVSERGPDEVRAAFDRVVRAGRRGVLLPDALTTISNDLGSAFHPLATTLVVAAQGGSPVGALLQRLADEAGQARRRAIQARVQRLPVQLIVPLVVCHLPAVLIGSVLPLAILALRSL